MMGILKLGMRLLDAVRSAPSGANSGPSVSIWKCRRHKTDGLRYWYAAALVTSMMLLSLVYLVNAHAWPQYGNVVGGATDSDFNKADAIGVVVGSATITATPGSDNVTLSIKGTGFDALFAADIAAWTGSSNVVTLGTIATGTWNATAIADNKISSAATWNAKQAALGTGAAGTFLANDQTWQTPTIDTSGLVPNTRTVNGHALSADVTVTAGDVGLGNVTNDAQTKAAIVPNTAPAVGALLVGNAGGTAYASAAMSGDATLASTGAITVAKAGGVSFGSGAFATVTGSNTGDQFASTTASALLGRTSAGAGAAGEITLGTNLSMSGTTLNSTTGGTVTASRLLGRGSAGGDGAAENIVLGTNLSMSGTTLNATASGGGGGGSRSFTASGAITPSGSLVALRTDGKVEAITGSNVTTTTTGTTVPFNATATSFNRIAYSTADDKFLVTYKGLSGYTYAVVITVTGTVVTYGTPVTLYAGTSEFGDNHMGIAYSSVANKFLITYKVASSIRGLVATISGTTVTFGTSIQVSTANAYQSKVVYKASIDKFVIALNNVSAQIDLVVATISGTDVSLGSVVSTGVAGGNISLAYNSTDGTILLAWRPGTTNLSMAAVSVSGTVPSLGTVITPNGAQTTTYHDTATVYDSLNNVFYVCFENGSGYISVYVVNIVGSAAVLGALTESTIGVHATTFGRLDAVYNHVTERALITYLTVTNGYASVVPIIPTLSGTSVSFGTAVTFNSTASSSLAIAINTAGIFATTYSPSSTYGNVIAGTMEGTYSNGYKWIGIAQSAVTDGQAVDVNLLGSVDAHQSGLITGNKYYGSYASGTILSTNEANYGEVGRAVSATELYITNGGSGR